MSDTVLCQVILEKQIKDAVTGPLLRFSQAIELAGSMIRLTSVLALRFRDKPIPFLTGFFSQANEAQMDFQMLTGELWSEIESPASQCETYSELAMHIELARHGHLYDPELIAQMDKIKLFAEDVRSILSMHVAYGISIGFCAPERVRELFENQYKLADTRKWDEGDGSDIEFFEDQDIIPFGHYDQYVAKLFLQFCFDFHPETFHQFRT